MKHTLLPWLFFACLVSAFAVGAPPQPQRFLFHARELRAILTSGYAPERIVDALAKKNGRLAAFRLQGLCRLYEEAHPEWMEEWKNRFKKLKDTLGRYTDAVSHLSFAQALKADERLLKYLRKEEREAREQVAEFLVDKDWVAGRRSPKLDKFEADLREMDWESHRDDLKYVVGQLRGNLDELLEEEIDLFDLQGGLHELRRMVRWFLIDVQALTGMFLLDESDCPVESYRSYLSDPLAQSPYMEIHRGKWESVPVLIPKCYYVALSRLTEDLGLTKDLREAAEEWLPEALLHGGLATGSAEARRLAAAMVRRHPRYRDPIRLGRESLKRLRRPDLIPVLRALLKGQRTRCNALLKAAAKAKGD